MPTELACPESAVVEDVNARQCAESAKDLGSRHEKQVLSRCAKGISLVEVLVGIGIAGLLLSLLLPAIQSAREAARRAQCTSNLRQLIVGLQGYHDLHQRFPPTSIWAPAGEPLGQGLAPPGTIDRLSAGVAAQQDPDRMFASWVILLLPCIEESELFEAFDLRKPIGSVVNQRGCAAEVGCLKCPSDVFNGPGNHFNRTHPVLSDRMYSRSNFAMNAGPNERCLARLGPAGSLSTCPDGFQVDGSDLRVNTSKVWGSGIGGVNRSFAIKDCLSGTSKVIAIEEIRAGVHASDRRGVWALGYPGSSVTAAHGSTGNGGPNIAADRIQGCTMLANAINDPSMSDMPCAVLADASMEICEQATARSMHPSGINAATADGAVHFVANSIDAAVWETLHKRNSLVPLERERE